MGVGRLTTPECGAFLSGDTIFKARWDIVEATSEAMPQMQDTGDEAAAAGPRGESIFIGNHIP
jgi:hypothetical protein